MAPRTLARESTDRFATFGDACRIYRIKTKGEGLVTFDPARWHDEQRRFDAERTGRDLVLKPRQVGFSTLELLRGLWQAHTLESRNVQVVIHDRDLAESLFDIVHTAYDAATGAGASSDPGRDRIREIAFHEIGSAIRVTEAGATKRTAAKKGRSGTIHRLHATEVAFWAQPGEAMAGLLGAVPDSGEVLIESTPNGAAGWFYDEVQKALEGRSRYKLHFFPWWKHRSYRLDPEPDFDRAPKDRWEHRLRGYGCDDAQITWWRAKVSDLTLDKALQEYPADVETCFRMAGRAYIAPDVIDRMTESLRTPLRRYELRLKDGTSLGWAVIYEEPDPRAAPGDYVIGGDVAEGVEQDASAAAVLHRTSGRTVATFWSDTIEPGDFGHAMAQLGWIYGQADVAPERNNHGHAVIRALEREAKYERIFRHIDDKLGWKTDLATRPPLFDELARAVREGSATTPDHRTLRETKTLVIREDGKPGHPIGGHDDCFVGWAIAWQLRSKPRWTPRSFKIRNL